MRLRASSLKSARAFTLIELILVMTVLAIAASITAPALANFFRGRTLESEARRLLSLTRQGQSRAVSEGVPMELWLDSTRNAYGLEAEPSYDPTDSKAVNITMDKDLQLQATTLNLAPQTTSSSFSSSMNGTTPAAPVSNHPGLPRVRFLPDGTVADGSPELVQLTHRDGKSLWLALSRSRLNYEIQNRNTP
jgi:prepilin-type N-terminal cleavage/methylation domain-containing protein